MDIVRKQSIARRTDTVTGEVFSFWVLRVEATEGGRCYIVHQEVSESLHDDAYVLEFAWQELELAARQAFIPDNSPLRCTCPLGPEDAHFPDCPMYVV